MKVVPWTRGSSLLRGRVPVRIAQRRDGRHAVAWAVPSRPLLETPMYDWAAGGHDVRWTDIDVLVAYGERFDWEKLRGCVFHVSRCGSTAIANAFRAVDQMLVISEARTLTSILLPSRYGGIRASPELKTVLAGGFMAAALKECSATSVVLKFPSFLSVDIARTMALLPPVRWCFSSRSPAEVIRSLERSPGGWLGDAPRRAKARLMLGLPPSDPEPKLESARNLYAYLLERCFAAALDALDDRTICLDYAEFGAATVEAVVRFVLGRDLDEPTRDQIKHSLGLYSKSLTQRPFVPDQPLGDQPTGFPSLDRIFLRYRAGAKRFGARSAADGIVNVFDGSL